MTAASIKAEIMRTEVVKMIVGLVMIIRTVERPVRRGLLLGIRIIVMLKIVGDEAGAAGGIIETVGTQGIDFRGRTNHMPFKCKKI